MRHQLLRWQAPCIGVVLLGIAGSARAQEPLFEDLPFGLFVEKCTIISADRANQIGQKLGGEISRLSNSVVKIHGTLVPVNVIEGKTEADAEAIHRSLLKMKSNPAFAVRKGRTVVEYPGNELPAAAAIKASWELGLVPTPKEVHYRVTADLATVEEVDALVANELLNLFLSPAFEAGDAATLEWIEKLKSGIQFGSWIDLRIISREGGAIPKFSPELEHWPSPSPNGAFRYQVPSPKKKAGIPFVTVTLETIVDDSGTSANASQTGAHLVAATARWPVNDREIQSLARQITAGERSDEDKVQAILEWLAPGKNLKHAGPTGSRWGVRKALEQKNGHCWDASDIFVTLARASGIPSRQVAGWLYGGSGHVWAEVLVGEQWHQVDPSGAGKLDCGIYHIPWFTTENGEMPILYLSMPKIAIVSSK